MACIPCTTVNDFDKVYLTATVRNNFTNHALNIFLIVPTFSHVVCETLLRCLLLAALLTVGQKEKVIKEERPFMQTFL